MPTVSEKQLEAEREQQIAGAKAAAALEEWLDSGASMQVAAESVTVGDDDEKWPTIDLNRISEIDPAQGVTAEHREALKQCEQALNELKERKRSLKQRLANAQVMLAQAQTAHGELVLTSSIAKVDANRELLTGAEHDVKDCKAALEVIDPQIVEAAKRCAEAQKEIYQAQCDYWSEYDSNLTTLISQINQALPVLRRKQRSATYKAEVLGLRAYNFQHYGYL